MKSAAWLQGHSGDRPSFQATVCRTFSTRPYQVFAMPQGLLFLEVRNKPGVAKEANTGAIVLGGVLGGALGAGIAHAMTSGPSDSGKAENFELCSEDELFQIAKERKRSFVSKLDEIQSITIDAPSGLSRMFADSTLAGWITLRDRKLGKVSMEIHDQASMQIAVDALPRRLKERVFVNVEFDHQTTKFRPKGR